MNNTNSAKNPQGLNKTANSDFVSVKKPVPVPNDASETATRRRATRRLLRAEAYYAFSLTLFSVLAAFAYIYPYFNWDLAATQALQSIRIPGLYDLMRIVSIPGNGLTPHALTAIACIIFLSRGRRSEAAGLLFSAGGSALLNMLIKIIVARPRPTSDLVTVVAALGSRSFPSGHVTFYVCYFGFLFFTAYALLPRRRVVLFLTILPVLLIGFSRIYLGAHWLSDTIGAYLMSGMWLTLSLELYRRWKQKRTFH